jgi:hypothetical protein
MSVNQAGINLNLTNFGLLITRISVFPAGYNPSRSELSIASLTNCLNHALDVKTSFLNALVVEKNAMTQFNSSFDGFDSLITRVGNAVAICGAPLHTIDQVHVVLRDLHGRRATPLVTKPAVTTDKTVVPESNQITRHISNTESKLESFATLIQALSTIPLYKPNEEDLSNTGLAKRYSTMKMVDMNYKTASASLDAARQLRNNTINAEGTGLVDIANAAKTYVKSVYGATSHEYKSISDLVFKKVV